MVLLNSTVRNVRLEINDTLVDHEDKKRQLDIVLTLSLAPLLHESPNSFADTKVGYFRNNI